MHCALQGDLVWVLVFWTERPMVHGLKEPTGPALVLTTVSHESLEDTGWAMRAELLKEMWSTHIRTAPCMGITTRLVGAASPLQQCSESQQQQST